MELRRLPSEYLSCVDRGDSFLSLRLGSAFVGGVMKRAHLESLLYESFGETRLTKPELKVALDKFFSLWEVDDSMEMVRHLERQRREFRFLIFVCFLLGLLMLMLFGSIAVADAAPVVTARVTYVRGLGNIPRAQARRISEKNAAYLTQKTGVRVRYRSFRVVAPFAIPGHLSNIEKAKDLLDECDAYNWSRGCKMGICHCIFPPIVDKGDWWIAGYADAVCCQSCPSFTNAMKVNGQGESRWLYSLVAERHEWAHILGMKEKWEEPCELAYTGVLYCIERNQYEISKKSIKEIRQCTEDWKPYGKQSGGVY